MSEVNMSIEPKSDQLNADDLIVGPRTIKVTKVTAGATEQQPVNVHFEGDNNKPFRPCKSMRRIMVICWGVDAKKYAGRSMTLFHEPSVKYGGMEVGGIRVSHMTDIEKDMAVLLTVTRAKKERYHIKKLEVKQPATKTADKPASNAQSVTDALITRIFFANTKEEVAAITSEPKVATQLDWLSANRPDLSVLVEAEIHQRGEANE